MSELLPLLGLAKKAGRLELGEEPVGAACRARKARIVLLAADAAENTIRRATHFGEIGGAPVVSLPFTKSELGMTTGRSSCAVLALTDVGFAASLVKKLAATDPGQYEETAALLSVKAEKAKQRQKEMRAHEKKLQRGKTPWSAKPAQASSKKRHSDQS